MGLHGQAHIDEHGEIADAMRGAFLTLGVGPLRPSIEQRPGRLRGQASLLPRCITRDKRSRCHRFAAILARPKRINL